MARVGSGKFPTCLNCGSDHFLCGTGTSEVEPQIQRLTWGREPTVIERQMERRRHDANDLVGQFGRDERPWALSVFQLRVKAGSSAWDHPLPQSDRAVPERGERNGNDAAGCLAAIARPSLWLRADANGEYAAGNAVERARRY